MTTPYIEAKKAEIITEFWRLENQSTEGYEEFLGKVVDTLLDEIQEAVLETLEISYSEHDEYTDDTLRYHEKQKKVFAERFQHLRTGVETNS